MSDAINILKRAKSLDKAPQFAPYSKVIIHAGTDDDGNEVVYTAGDDTGRTLETVNDWGSQAMAENICAQLRGWQYQPYTATGASVDPSMEIGDGVTVNGLYSGIFSVSTNFNSLMKSEISAPVDEEIEHEFGQESATDRTYTRFVKSTKADIKLTYAAIEAEVEARTESEGEIRATLAIQADDIQARVTKTGTNDSSTFGWDLQSDHWSVFSGSESNEVFRVDADGAEVKGTIRATAGSIGGFTIGRSAIYNNISSYGGSQSSGVYLGTNGIQLGQGFKVSSSGSLYATSGTFTGTVYAGSISYGGNAGTFSGSGLTSGTVGGTQISDGAVSKAKTTKGVQTSLTNGDTALASFKSLTAGSVRAERINTNSLGIYGNLYMNDGGQSTCYWKSIKDGDGNTVRVLSNR